MFFKIIVASTTAAILGTGFMPAPVPIAPAPPRPHVMHAEHASHVVMEVPETVPFDTPSRAEQREMLRLLTLVSVRAHKGTYRTGKLAGSNVGGLYAAYWGHKGRVPSRLTVDWNKQLRLLWKRKAAIPGSATIVDVTGDMLVAEYERLDPERMSLREYQDIADAQAKLVYRNLDWKEVCATYFTDSEKHVDQKRCALLKRVARLVDGRVLMSYMMTELLPTSGNYGRAYVDFLLRNAGRRYVESIPALHDSYTSFGPFQFTAKAVYDMGYVPTVGGVTRVNRALPSSLRVPGSVSFFREDDHLRAAYLFAVSNFAVFIRRLDDRRFALFGRIAASHRQELAQFIATAHNKPETAYDAGEAWLRAKAGSAYRDHCPEASRRYAQKTIENYRALAL